MTALDRSASILTNPIRWSFDFDLFFLFEIDVAAIHTKLPRGTFPAQVRPDVGLVGISLEVGLPGNIGGTLPGFTEINWCVALETDLSRKMPVPRFSVVTGKVGADNEAFLDHCQRVDKLPVYRSQGLKSVVDREGFHASAEDEHGPIFSLTSTHRSRAEFRRRKHWVQLRSVEDGEWFQALSWEGLVCEHQQGHRAGVLHQHPFFDGIDVAGVGDRCYLQMLGAPSQRIEVDFYEPIRVDAKAKR